MEGISFTVMGNPKALKRHRTGKFGNYDPSKQDKEDFLWLAHNSRPERPIEGPIKLTLKFCFKRPKNHYGTGKNSRVLKTTSPIWHTGRPDTDNLVKFVADSLNGVYWLDDSQICVLDCIKVYDEHPRTEVLVSTINKPELAILTQKANIDSERYNAEIFGKELD